MKNFKGGLIIQCFVDILTIGTLFKNLQFQISPSESSEYKVVKKTNKQTVTI
jgi:hypothetical protein